MFQVYKKLLYLFAALLLAATIAACSTDENASAPKEPDNAQTEQPEPVKEPEPKPEPKPEPEPAKEPEPQPEPAKPAQPEPSTDPYNIALASNGTTVEVDSYYSNYTKDPINDGYRVEDFLGPHDVAWASSLEGDGHWVEFTFPEPKTPERVDIYWGELHASQEIHLQVLQDGEWVTVHTWTNDEGNMLMTQMEIEEPVETTAFRIFQEKDKGPVAYRDPNILWISEVEIYEPNRSSPRKDIKNIALASNGATVAVDSTHSSYTLDPINDGLRLEEYLSWKEVAWASTLEGDNHWVEFTFPEPKTPRRVDIYWSERNIPSQEIQIQVPDNGDWKTIQTWSTDELSMVMVSIEIENPVETNKLRLFQDKDKGPIDYSNPNIMWMSEVEIYE